MPALSKVLGSINAFSVKTASASSARWASLQRKIELCPVRFHRSVYARHARNLSSTSCHEGVARSIPHANPLTKGLKQHAVLFTLWSTALWHTLCQHAHNAMPSSMSTIRRGSRHPHPASKRRRGRGDASSCWHTPACKRAGCAHHLGDVAGAGATDVVPAQPTPACWQQKTCFERDQDVSQ